MYNNLNSTFCCFWVIPFSLNLLVQNLSEKLLCHLWLEWLGTWYACPRDDLNSNNSTSWCCGIMTWNLVWFMITMTWSTVHRNSYSNLCLFKLFHLVQYMRDWRAVHCATFVIHCQIFVAIKSKYVYWKKIKNCIVLLSLLCSCRLLHFIIFIIPFWKPNIKTACIYAYERS